MASVTTNVMTENYPIVTRSEREACTGQHDPSRTEELVDRLIAHVEQILDVKREIEPLDAAADRDGHLSPEISPRVSRIDYRYCRERSEVAVGAAPHVQHTKVEVPVCAGVSP